MNEALQKDAIKNAYRKLENILQESLSNVLNLRGVNSEFNTIKRRIVSAFSTKVKEAQTELDTALNGTVWDNLVIAFFGETNAGKSTIIETFRILFDENRKKEDGLIVGDGRHDFTKTYNEYHLSISGHPFTLIDVPGIEGEEADFKDVIKKALHKAHCVFYVQGHNKKPDRATAEKIKKYLGDWVKVYSIYNVRGSVGNYDEEEERETLFTANVLTTENLIKSEFKSILGNVYAGHVTLQGLLAMSAKAKFSYLREDLIRNQEKLLRYFGGSSNKVLEFSQFKTLINLVEQKSSDFNSEIIEANKQKLISLASKVHRDIEAEMNYQKESLDRLENKLQAVGRMDCMDAAPKNISNKIGNAIDRVYNNLGIKIDEIIDENPSNMKQRAEYLELEVKWEMRNRIENIILTELKEVQDSVNRKIKELDGVNVKQIIFHDPINFNSTIDFSEAQKKLDFNWDAVCSWGNSAIGGAGLGASIGSFIPGIGTFIGACIGFSIGSLFGGASADKNGKNKAKEIVSKEIDKAKLQAKKSIRFSIICPIIKDIEDQKRILHSSVSAELQNIDQLQNTIDEFGKYTTDFVNSIKQYKYGRI